MKKPTVAAIAMACVAVAVLCGFRIEQVNASYPERHSYSYSLGEEATYAGQDSSGRNVLQGSIVLRVLDFRAVGYEELKKIVPEYKDSIVDNDSSADMRAFLVNIAVKNNTKESQQFIAPDCRLQSGAWMNGLYIPLYLAINGASSSVIELEPNQKVTTQLIYLMYTSQVNNSRDWDRIDQRSFSLVLSLYPDKYFIDLGTPTSSGGKGGVV